MIKLESQAEVRISKNFYLGTVIDQDQLEKNFPAYVIAVVGLLSPSKSLWFGLRPKKWPGLQDRSRPQYLQTRMPALCSPPVWQVSHHRCAYHQEANPRESKSYPVTRRQVTTQQTNLCPEYRTGRVKMELGVTKPPPQDRSTGNKLVTSWGREWEFRKRGTRMRGDF